MKPINYSFKKKPIKEFLPFPPLPPNPPILLLGPPPPPPLMRTNQEF